MPLVIRQGTLNCAGGLKLQTLWGFREASIFTLEGLGATILGAGAALAWMPGVALGVTLIALAVVLLLSHLGHPRRAWLAVRNIRRSWISMGTLVIGGSVALGVLWLTLRWAAAPQGGSWWHAALAWLLVLCALFILVYPGLVLSASPAIPFWNSGLLPMVSLALGSSSGLAVLIWLWAVAHGGAGLPPGLVVLELLLLGALALSVAAYVLVMRQSAAAAHASVRMLLREELAWFGLLACGAGVAAPALLMLAVLAGGATDAAWLAMAALAKLCGDVGLRYAFIKVGMFDAVV